ncbi:MAG: LysR substrate-binding domain-containing protein [Coxiellaceae bacterium]|nr:LysR substrate-binding domain-containing protein [Coxiellaceae bacterium]
MRITLRQLEVFVNTAKNSSLKQGAEASHMTPAAASMSLVELERHLGVKLFDRIGKRIKLNELGKALLPKAVSTLDHALELQDFAITHQQEMVGTVMIGASTSIGNYVLPKYIALFKMMYPSVHCKVFISNTEEVVNGIESLTLDIGLIEGICHSDAIIEKRWLKDELKIICRGRHPLTKRETVRLSDLSEYPWIMREGGSGAREIFTEALAHKIDMKKEVTLNSFEAIKNYVIHSNCLAYVSHAVISNEEQARSIKVLKVKGVNIVRDFHLITHRDKYQTAVTQKFIEFLNQQAKS